MRQYTILPLDPRFPSTEVRAPDASCALYTLTSSHCDEADVFEDGAYTFSLRIDDDEIWCIFQRPSAERVLTRFPAGPIEQSTR